MLFYTESKQQGINFCLHFRQNGVGAVRSVYCWCRYQPVASSSKRLCPFMQGTLQTWILSFLKQTLVKTY